MKLWMITAATCLTMVGGAAFGQTAEKHCQEKKEACSEKASEACADKSKAKGEACSDKAQSKACAGKAACDKAKACDDKAKVEACADKGKAKSKACADKGRDKACGADATITASVVGASSMAQGPVNKACPMSGKAINAAYVAQYQGKQIAFCGPGCKAHFEKADAAGKEKIFKTALASMKAAGGACDKCDSGEKCDKCEDEGAEMRSGGATGEAMIGDAYPLNTCVVSGGKLGGMGDPIVKVYNGRQVKFCCEMCVPKFEANPEKYLSKVDAQIIKDQMAFYPLDTCLMSGKPLGADAQNFVIGNRLVRTCCERCAAKAKASPAKTLKTLDEKVIAKQSERYPLDTCLISGEPLEAGGPQVVVAGRLVKTCCKSCAKKVMKAPAKYLTKLDKAWMAKYPEQFKKATASASGG